LIDNKIHIFWFKRELRIEDNEALQAACSSGKPLLVIYLYEKSIWENPHYSARHLNFIKESLRELGSQCAVLGLKLQCVEAEALPFFQKIKEHYKIDAVYSTRETGLDITYKRDLEVQNFLRSNQIVWNEYQNNGVLRAINNRDDWKKAWYAYMQSPLCTLPEGVIIETSAELITFVDDQFDELDLETPEHDFQKGGRAHFEQWSTSFFEARLEYYNQYISKPDRSHFGCSRLSPYISWGVCSIREVYQRAETIRGKSAFKRELTAFKSRLRWQSHFIQKFEQEPRMEFEAVNKGFLEMNQPLNERYIEAWKSGKTGYPLVDAAQRSVASCGYLNFRMRAMVTSFLTHHLFQHFTTGSAWLARQFLDFEPGIHYGQFQMQAGLTGTNTVRVYNPTKNAQEHDPEAIFIKKWVPELRELPVQFAIEPWKMTAMEEQLYNFKLGMDYPQRIVLLQETRAYALDKLYSHRKSDKAHLERLRILKTHTIRKPSDKDDAKQI